MNRLRELRQKTGKSMLQIAKDLHIAYTTYAHYETCVREPNSEMLIKLADFFGVSIDYLIGRTDKPNETYTPKPAPSPNEKNGEILTDDERDELNLYRQLNEKNQGKIQGRMEQMIEEQGNKTTREHKPTFADYGEIAAFGGKSSRPAIKENKPEITNPNVVKKSRSGRT